MTFLAMPPGILLLAELVEACGGGTDEALAATCVKAELNGAGAAI